MQIKEEEKFESLNKIETKQKKNNNFNSVSLPLPIYLFYLTIEVDNKHNQIFFFLVFSTR